MMSNSSPSNAGDGQSDYEPDVRRADFSTDRKEPSLDATRDYESFEADSDCDSNVDLLPRELLEDAGNGRERRIGKYILQGQLGHGGMGVVWKALDPDLNRVVAIKFLSRHLLQSPIARRRFQREARAAAAISHPNVLTIHSVEEQKGIPFLVMEYVAGQSLKEYIQTKGKVDAVEVIRLSTQIAQGLAAAHAQGVIHRDVKPGNVMLHDGATRVRLMDFGLARVAFDNAELTSHDHTVGTPAYTAPEQICGDPVDARADLFSLGCLMYSMLVGHSPFLGRAPAETVHRITSSEPPRLSDLDPSVPPVLADIIQKLLRKEPNERYQSAYEVSDVLKRLLMQLNQSPTDEIDELLHRRVIELSTVSAKVSRPNENHWLKWAALSVTGIGIVAAAFALTTDRWMGVRPDGNQTANPPSSDGAVPGSQPAIPAPLLTEISVARDGTASCATLNDALAQAAKNCTITVLDEGPYEETLTISGERFEGLTLIAAKKARWQLPAGSKSHLLTMSDVASVTIRGFVLEVSERESHAVLLSGSLDNIVFEENRFQQTIEAGGTPLVEAVLKEGQEVNDQRPVSFRRCEFLAEGLGLHWRGNDVSALPLRLEDCYLTGKSTLVFLNYSCRDTRISGNVFAGGTNAINVDFKAWPAGSRLEILNNTFVGSKHWLGFVLSKAFAAPPGGSATEAMGPSSRVMNNLILGGERVQGNDQQITQALAEWKFAANWWEQESATRPNAGWDGRLAEMKESVGVSQRDNPRDPDYLVPESGSPLLSAGVGGDLPAYIGARGRREEARSP